MFEPQNETDAFLLTVTDNQLDKEIDKEIHRLKTKLERYKQRDMITTVDEDENNDASFWA